MSANSKSQYEFQNKLSGILEANLEHEQFGVSELAHAMGMSRSSLHRKIREIYHISASQYLREKRLEKGRELLQETSYTVSEVAFKVGFSSVSYFITCYRDYFGHTPGDKEHHEDSIDVPDEVDAKSKTPLKRYFKRLGTEQLDRSDLIVWSIVFIFLANIVFINFGPKIKSSGKEEIWLAIPPFEDNSPSGEIKMTFRMRLLLQTKLENIDGLHMVSIVNSNALNSNKLNVSETGKALKATHLLKGSGQTLNGETEFFFSLVEVKSEKTIWSRIFPPQMTDKISDLSYNIMAEILDTLNISFNQKEQELIKKDSNFVELAIKYYDYGIDALDRGHLSKDENVYAQAIYYFNKAIEYDSTFPEPYIRLAHIYQNVYATTFNQNATVLELLRDTALKYVNKAIQFDPNNSWAYSMKSDIYKSKGLLAESKQFKLISDSLQAEAGIDESNFAARKYWSYNGKSDFCNAARSYFEFLKSDEKNNIIRYLNITGNFIFRLDQYGFPEISLKFIKRIYDENKDSSKLRSSLLWKDFYKGDYKKVLENSEEWMNKYGNEQNAYPMWKMNMAVLLDDTIKAKNYLDDYLSFRTTLGKGSTMYEFLTGIYYYKTGNEKAELFLDRIISNFEESLESTQLNEHDKNRNAIWLAGIYAIMGNKKNCFESLNFVANKEIFDKEHLNYLDCYFFDSVREELQFQKIYARVDSIYQDMHKCVKEVLIQNDEIPEESVQ